MVPSTRRERSCRAPITASAGQSAWLDTHAREPPRSPRGIDFTPLGCPCPETPAARTRAGPGSGSRRAATGSERRSQHRPGEGAPSRTTRSESDPPPADPSVLLEAVLAGTRRESIRELLERLSLLGTRSHGARLGTGVGPKATDVHFPLPTRCERSGFALRRVSSSAVTAPTAGPFVFSSDHGRADDAGAIAGGRAWSTKAEGVLQVPAALRGRGCRKWNRGGRRADDVPHRARRLPNPKSDEDERMLDAIVTGAQERCPGFGFAMRHRRGSATNV
jgi:hypothetical protein